mmetsp:Transcript_14536/g.32504  ORF Transcript_14536/g.32504 Transcript_14536/m.32504 type:complete len:189 (+) Transcript_14536:3-569(+)
MRGLYLAAIAVAAPMASAFMAPSGMPLRQASASRASCRAAPRLDVSMITDAGKDKLKGFLDETKGVGRIRLICTNDASVMEAICTTDKLFYASGGPKQLEYANIIDPSINLDLHLLLEGVGGARFETGVSRTPTKDPTYIIRMLGTDQEKVVASFFLQWDKAPSDIEPERIAAWQAMKTKYGDSVDFA